MGKDRNHPLHVRLQLRDHFDDPAVCKFNLINFCPYDLFPNTRHDQGPCKGRHDDFLKHMFESDPDADAYARAYDGDLMNHLTKMVATVDAEIKRALARAENPVQGNNRVERQAIEQASLLQKKLLEDPDGFISKDRALDSGRNPISNAPEMTELQKDQLYRRID